jgi:2-iminobutanoate/2-iminopropanoate deaminase
LGLTLQGNLAGADVAAQARQSLENVRAILAESEMTFADVIKATIFNGS